VEPGLPAVLDDPKTPFVFPDAKAHPEWNHTGRRLELAKWLVSPKNPLTARVFVNRVWQFHFGEGIVRSVDDFGRQGEKPSHPELLDYLAVEFQKHNWDLKWLTKQIVMSQVYRQDSAENAECLKEDPSNHLLWRKAPLRLEAEAIRDSMLLVSGLLDSKMYGRQEPLKRGADGQWMEDDEKGNGRRRSIYLKQSRTRPVAFLHSFDAPTMNTDHETQRFRSALPTQSLALLNSPFVEKMSKAFAGQLLEQANQDVDAAVRMAVMTAYSRAAREGELAVARELIQTSGTTAEGLRLFVQALFGANDFLYSY
jgi:hypothetical protein